MKSDIMHPPTLFFFKVVLVILAPLPLYNFRISLLKCTKKSWWALGWDCIDSVNQYGENWHLNNLSLLFHEHGISLHLLTLSLTSFVSVLWFSACISYTYLVRFIPKYSFYGAITNDTVFEILTSNCSLLAQKYNRCCVLVLFL